MLDVNIIKKITDPQCSEGARIEFLKGELQKNPELLKEIDEKGRTLLHLLCVQSSPEPLKLLEVLIERGASLSAKDAEGETPLHSACSKGRMEIAKALIARDAGLINARTKLGDTPLILAVRNASFTLVEYLSTLPTCIDFANGTGETALSFADQYLYNDISKAKNPRKEVAERNKVKGCLILLKAKKQVCDICKGDGDEKNKAKQLQQIYREHSKIADGLRAIGGGRNSLLQLIIAMGDSKVTLAFLEAVKQVQDEDGLSKQMADTSLAASAAPKEEIYLFLGGGNLSFELSFAQKHPDLARKMVVTTYEALASFLPNGSAGLNKILLEKLGVRVIHGIDAKQLGEYEVFKDKQFKRVYFCHPFPPGHSNQTAQLITGFFRSVTPLQNPNDKVIIARLSHQTMEDRRKGYKHGRGGWGYGFSSLQNSAEPFYHRLEHKHKFGGKRYPGYTHVTTGSGAHSPVFEGSSVEYPFQKMQYCTGYFSDSDTDSESDTETSGLVLELELRNRAGQTALHAAVASGDLVVVSRLLEFGAIPDTIDGSGRTALCYAIDLEDEQKGLQMAALLVSKGADPNFQSVIAGFPTPLDYARQKNKAKILALFQNPDPRGAAKEILSALNPEQLCVTSTDGKAMVSIAAHAMLGEDKKVTASCESRSALTPYQQIIQHLYAQGDDTSLATIGHDSHYWYSITDVMVLLRSIRREILGYKMDSGGEYPTKSPGEEDEFNRENRQHVLLTNPYVVDYAHPEFFRQSFLSDVNAITGRLRGEDARRNHEWQDVPQIIVIPVLTGVHWCCVRVAIDYGSHKASILWDDPYGKDRFSPWIKGQIKPVLIEAINIFLSKKTGAVLPPDKNLYEVDKPHNQQGDGNGVDCGPITVGNCRDYINPEVTNEGFASPRSRYSISLADHPDHQKQITAVRTEHVAMFLRETGQSAASTSASATTSKKTDLPAMLNQQAKEACASLSQIIGDLSIEDLDLVLNFVYAHRFETGKIGNISQDELDQAHHQLQLLRERQKTLPHPVDDSATSAESSQDSTHEATDPAIDALLPALQRMAIKGDAYASSIPIADTKEEGGKQPPPSSGLGAQPALFHLGSSSSSIETKQTALQPRKPNPASPGTL